MKGARFLILVLALFALATVPTAAAPLHSAPLRDFLASPCAPGAAYDPACDVNHDNQISITDIQLTAGHWNQNGTWVSDNLHNHLGQTWVGSNNPLKIEGLFGSPDSAALVLRNNASGGDGLLVPFAAHHGVDVNQANYHGVQVSSTGLNGVNVDSAGAHGLRVDSAGGVGVLVGSAGTVGLYVGSAGSEGFQLGSGGDTGVDGVEINAAGDDGVDVNQANDNGIAVSDAVNWEINVIGDVFISGICSGCESAIFAQNVGDTVLQPGDVVAVKGILKPELAHTPAVAAVMQAQGSGAVIGVVSSRAELVFDGDEPEDAGLPDLVPREGAAQPGDYVSIIVDGMVQVRVDARQGAIQAGQRLTGGESAGTARPLRSVEVDGVELAESAPVLGIALEDLEQGEGLIWVLVNPQ